jgi:tetratricopeptide (TPR) repeat protein
VVAEGWLVIDKVLIETPLKPGQSITENANESPSIAVLPFVNMSTEADSAFFSDGLADTLLHMLAQIKELRVAARTSSFRFRDQSMDVAERIREINPRNPTGLQLLASIDIFRGEWEAALVQYKQAAALDPDDPEFAVAVGDAYLRLELPLEAGQWYDRAVEIAPNHPVSLSRPLHLNWYATGNDSDNVRAARNLLEARY